MSRLHHQLCGLVRVGMVPIISEPFSQRGSSLIRIHLFTVLWQVADVWLPGDGAEVNYC